MKQRESFLQLKDVCVPLAHGFSLKKLREFSMVVKRLSPSDKSLFPFVGYVLVPFSELLSDREKFNKLGESIQIRYFKVLEEFFARVSINVERAFWDIFIRTMRLSTDVKADRGSRGEDFLLSATRMLRAMFKNSVPVLWGSIADLKQQPAVGFLVHNLLEHATKSKLRDLQIVSLDFLRELCENFKVNAGIAGRSMLNEFFPGIVSGTSKVLVGDFKHGHLVKIAALKAMTAAIVIILPKASEKEQDFTETLQKVTAGGPSAVLQEADGGHEQLRFVLEHCFSLPTKPDPRLSLVMAQCASRLLQKCGNTMSSESRIVLLECLLSLSEDSGYPEIQEAALHSLSSVDFTGEFLTRFEYHFASLPTKARVGHSSDKISAFRLCSAYIGLLSEDEDSFSCNFEAIVIALLQVAKVDPSTAVLSVEPSAFTYCFYRTPFTHLHDSEAIESFFALLRRLGSGLGQNLYELIVFLLESLHAPGRRRERVLIANIILEGALKAEPAGREGIVNLVVDAYLDPVLWRDGSLVVPLLLRGISIIFGAKLSKESIIMRVIYPILDQLRGRSVLFESAMAALERIADHEGHENPTAFVTANTDYLTDTILVKLQSPAEAPKCANMLSALLETTNDPRLLPLMQDVCAYLLDALDYCAFSEQTPFLRGVRAIARVLHKSEFQSLGKPALTGYVDNIEPEEALPKLSANDVILRVKEWKHDVDFFVRRHIPGDDIRELPATPSPIQDSEEFEKPNESIDKENQSLRFQQQMSSDILDRMIHILGSDDLKIIQLALDITEHALHALAHRRDVLMPLVAKLWENFKHLLDHKNKGILLASARLLTTLSHYCSNFLTRRFREDSWKSLKTILAEHHKEVFEERLCLSTDLEKTQSSRILVIVMDCLSFLAHAHPSLLRPILASICLTVSPILSSPATTVQRSARTLFSKLEKVNPDFMKAELIVLNLNKNFIPIIDT